jgi:hypothetical protein
MKYGGELSRLLTAAVVNQRFCKLLLANPASALASGYNGESFRLGKEEHDFILSIQAKNLADFARQLTGVHPVNNRYPRASVNLAFSAQ